MHILVTGASGSGTTTLGQAIAADLGAVFVDADDLFWLPTSPPFKEKRDREERAALLREKLTREQRTVVAGSVMGWDDELEHTFDFIIFLRAPADVRLPRLRARELARFGLVDEDFLAWAAQYDTGTVEGRCLTRQLAWLEQRRCPVVHLSGTIPIAALVPAVRRVLPK
jgi:adenylate kinase family enzyme